MNERVEAAAAPELRIRRQVRRWNGRRLAVLRHIEAGRMLLDEPPFGGVHVIANAVERLEL